MNGFRKRILAPLAIPLGATALVVIIVFNFSRVLLVVEEHNSAAVATFLATLSAAAVFLASAYFSSHHEARRAGLTVLASAAIVLVFAGGYGLGATGEGGETHAEGEAAAGGAEEPAGGGEITVVAKDPFLFEPKELTVPAGEVDITLTNEGAIVHTFLFEAVPDFEKLIASGTRRKAPGGEGPTVSATADLDPGTYVFYCDERGHRGAGMEGTLTVTEGGGGAATAPAGGGDATVVAKDPFLFEPKELTVPAGEVNITLTNEGAIVHTFLFEDVPDFEKLITSGTRRKAPGGEGTTVSATADLKPGTYVFYCDERGHRGAGMEGTLTVTEGGAGTARTAAAGGGGGGGGEATVVAKDPFLFEPKELTVPAGKVKITLTNEGAIVHTFLFEDVPDFEKLITSGTRRKAPGGEGTTVDATADLKPGTYVFYCDERGHRGAGMEGTLTVS